MNDAICRISLHTLLAAAMSVAAVASAADAADAAIAASAAGQPGERFDISTFQVQGNTLLTPRTVDALLKPYAGRNRDIADLRHAADALEAAYRARGFGLVQVVLPQQELHQGVVRLNVIETTIGKVTVEGNTVFDADNIRRSMPALREGTSPDLGRISDSLKLANENPLKKTTVQMHSGERDDQVDVLVKVADSRAWRLGASFDNSGSGNAGKPHVGLSFLHANLGGRDHVLILQYTTALEHPGDVRVFGAGYHIPLYALGDSVDLFGVHSDIDAGSVAAGIVNLAVSGKGAIYGARYNRNLARTGRYDGRLVFGIDYRAYKNDVRLLGLQLGNDVTVHPVSAGYAAKWTLAHTDLNLNVTAFHNLPGGSHGSDEDIRRARAGASGNYTVVRYGAGAAHAFAGDWQARVGINGQYTRDSLVPREQFGIGGADSVRGFTEREIADDRGYAGSVELYTPNLCARIERAAFQCRMLAFHDSAQISRNHPLPGERTDETISSAGIGLRFGLDRLLSAQLDVGRVMNAGGLQNKGDHRIHFLMNIAY
jgi:hemolysin activation/secretion protein